MGLAAIRALSSSQSPHPPYERDEARSGLDRALSKSPARSPSGGKGTLPRSPAVATPWLRELGTISISGVAGKHWVRQAVPGRDGALYLVTSGSKTAGQTTLLKCTNELEDPDQPWSAQGLGVRDGSPCMAMGAAAHGGLLLVSDYAMHRVVIFRDGHAVGELVADGMRQPCGVATSDGVRAFLAGSSKVHVFLIASGECIAAWPTATPDGACFECGHGLALHGDEVLLIDQRSCRVHVFSQQGVYVRSWGRPGRSPGCFQQPWGVAVSNGHVLVSEFVGRRVQIFSIDGVAVGELQPDPDGCGELAAIWAAEDGRVLLADWGKHCVRTLQLQLHRPSGRDPRLA